MGGTLILEDRSGSFKAISRLAPIPECMLRDQLRPFYNPPFIPYPTINFIHIHILSTRNPWLQIAWRKSLN